MSSLSTISSLCCADSGSDSFEHDEGVEESIQLLFLPFCMNESWTILKQSVYLRKGNELGTEQHVATRV